MQVSASESTLRKASPLMQGVRRKTKGGGAYFLPWLLPVASKPVLRGQLYLQRCRATPIQKVGFDFDNMNARLEIKISSQHSGPKEPNFAHTLKVLVYSKEFIFKRIRLYKSSHNGHGYLAVEPSRFRIRAYRTPLLNRTP